VADDVVLATTTDQQSVVEGAMSDDVEADRAEPSQHGSLSEFKESGDGQNIRDLSYESPQSERRTLLQRMQERDAALEEIAAEPEAEQVAEPEKKAAEPEKPVVELQPQNDRALKERELANLTAEIQEKFWARAKEIQEDGGPELTKALDEAIKENLQLTGRPDFGFSQNVLEAIIAQGGADLANYIAKNARIGRELARLPEHLALSRVGALGEQLKPARRVSTHSQAPIPIRPVGGSATPMATKDPDKMEYRDYVAWREKNRTFRR
jgi:hypothetical protein